MASAGSSEPGVVNITGYKFMDLPDRDALRPLFREECAKLGLKGLILLSFEGINYFLAGTPEATSSFRALLEDAAEGARLGGRFKDIPCKVSFSAKVPFKRLLVKLKREIISLGEGFTLPVSGEAVRPAERTGLRLQPLELKKWLDEGRPCVVLDTRNDYELRLGAFKNAVDLGLESFGEFPAAVAKLPDEARHLPVVTYCTGGVRCEKATTVLMDAGFTQVYQLEGGILGYLEQCKDSSTDSHWRGDCFVFDDRVAVDAQLRETDATMCFSCREPLTAADRLDPSYALGASCPYCAQKGKVRRFHAHAAPPKALPKAAANVALAAASPCSSTAPAGTPALATAAAADASAEAQRAAPDGNGQEGHERDTKRARGEGV